MVNNKIHVLVDDNINKFRRYIKEHAREKVQPVLHGEILGYASTYFKKVGSAPKRQEAFFRQVEADIGVPRPQKNANKESDGSRTLEYFLRGWLDKDGETTEYAFLIYYWFHVFAQSDQYADRIDKKLLKSKKYTRGTSYEIFFSEKVPGKAEIEAVRNHEVEGNGSNRELDDQSVLESEQEPEKSKARYQSRWPLTEDDVEDRLIEIQQRPFFGRDAAKKELDAFIDDDNNGLLIVSAPAGSGKSALLANWFDKLQESNEKVAYHLISNLYPSTTSAEAILGNLVEQIRMLQGKGGADITARDAPELGQQLYGELINYPKDEKRLILILDGLDEAANIIAPFVKHTGLPNNVFVIVSARKDGDAFPACLRYWKECLDRGLTGCFFNLSGLGEGDLKEWLQEVIGDLDIVESEELSTALLKTTDGLPLFLSYVIDDLKTSLPAMANREEILQFVTSMPAPFPKYIARQLNILAVEDQILSRKIQRLFATLSRTLGPIHKSDIEAVLGKDCPNLNMLDQRVSRWFSIGQGFYSFAHPRLARAFAQIIGVNEDEVVEAMPEVSNTTRDAEDRLINWMDEAWKPQKTKRGTQQGASYALDWLPEHLACLGTHGEREAAQLIADPNFLDERLRQKPKQASLRLSKNCDLWAALPFEAKTFDGARQWTAFWAENETSLKQASELFHPQLRPFADIVSNCLGDSFTSGSSDAPEGNACIYHSIPERGLIRSIDNAHMGVVERVFPIPGGGYVSLGQDGAIRFWDNKGTAITGGALDAHKGPFVGVLPTPDGNYVSWGEGAIRFWDKNGNSIAGGAPDAHKGRIIGLLPTAEGNYVSWGDDGAVRFWDKNGNPITGGAPDAHKGQVKGVLPIPGGNYVSWGEGAIRFWDKNGNSITGGAPDAHKGWINGLLPTPDGNYVSWGNDGAVRFWDKEGSATTGGASDVHKDWVREVLPTPDGGYVSWGQGGAIHFWDKEGSVTTGGASDAHKDRVLGVLPTLDGGFVSWGTDGAIRFWDKKGGAAAGGTQVADKHWVKGILPTPDGGYVSWGYRAIRFWNKKGNTIIGGVPDAHKGWVKGILPTPDGGYVSWGEDGAIRFWGKESRVTTGGAPDTSTSSVRGILPTLDSGFVTWSYDGAVRFWDKEGGVTTGGASDAHKDRILGVLPTSDGGFVSWGNDGAIRFWDKKGSAVAGGAPDAHKILVCDVLPTLDGGFVSWGYDGAIRFWDKKGSAAAGVAPDTHKGWVEGVLPTSDGGYIQRCGDGAFLFWDRKAYANIDAQEGTVRNVLPTLDGGFASWSQNGNIRIWDKEGNVIIHDASDALKVMVQGFLPSPDGGFVSWDTYGAIRFWDKKGSAAAGGAPDAHKGWINGVLPTPNGGYVSWGNDGAIHFWDKNGNSIAGGAPDAHKGWINGVLPTPDGNYVSWGSDDAIRFWNETGMLRGTLIPSGGVNFVKIIDNQLLAFGGKFWIYPLVDGLPWKENKDC